MTRSNPPLTPLTHRHSSTMSAFASDYRLRLSELNIKIEKLDEKREALTDERTTMESRLRDLDGTLIPLVEKAVYEQGDLFDVVRDVARDMANEGVTVSVSHGKRAS